MGNFSQTGKFLRKLRASEKGIYRGICMKLLIQAWAVTKLCVCRYLHRYGLRLVMRGKTINPME